MASKVKPIPDGYHTVTPHLVVKDGPKALDFYKKAFGAEEVGRVPGPGGKLMHAEFRIGNSRVMLCDEFPEMCARSPQSLGGSPVSLYLYVEDVDALFGRAKAAGAKEVRPVKDQFYGDRSGTLEDPFGHTWNLATHKEDVSMEEAGRRMAAWTTKKNGG